MDRGAWWAAVYGVAKSQTWLSDFTFTFHFHALEKEMATHSSVLAWRVPGTGEPGGLPSLGSHRVRHDWSDLAAREQKGSRNTQTLISDAPETLSQGVSVLKRNIAGSIDLIPSFYLVTWVWFQLLGHQHTKSYWWLSLMERMFSREVARWSYPFGYHKLSELGEGHSLLDFRHLISRVLTDSFF